MTYKYVTLFKWINVVTDYFLLNLSLYLSFMLVSPNSFWDSNSDIYRLVFLLLNLFWFYGSTLTNLYNNVLVRDAVATLIACLNATLIFIGTPLALSFVLPKYQLSLDFIFQAYILFTFSLIVWKVAFLFVRKYRRKYWVATEKVVIVGATTVGLELQKYIEANPNLGYKVMGIFDDNYGQMRDSNQHVIGKIEDCVDYVLSNGVSGIFCALPIHEFEKAKWLLQLADKHMIRYRLVPDMKAYFDKNVLLDQYGDLPILTNRREPLENKANEIIKRAFDISFSLLVIVLILSWLMPLLAVIIKLDSKGPVLFRQLRSGRGNKPFYCYKFRSMRVNTIADIQQASKGDPRITRIGAILRKTSLDELPQFFNVLKGEMSVVGPRPHMLKHTQDYSGLINNFMVRHFLTPGITGWAQVNGYRGETKETTAMTKRVDADIWYLENWTLLLDLKIIFLTIWHVFRGNINAV
ncbi:undecaprenyl-phosphate glucose phosphotransferase [Cesiribacter sp. SM1]|uniref:undecaprenyl-phosphate glucose phosphotransferase n=1 Tax=Cesiribacter sp. SM1 TaxID=2861196 RepID=UPI001CD579FA|nr:undecaprenyl-phosphate glucose phosphotransferase [Cesiribacter sp. SM1]